MNVAAESLQVKPHNAHNNMSFRREPPGLQLKIVNVSVTSALIGTACALLRVTRPSRWPRRNHVLNRLKPSALLSQGQLLLIGTGERLGDGKTFEHNLLTRQRHS